MRVHFGRADARMSEEFLNHPKVSAMFEQVRGETVTQHMWGDVAFDARCSNAFLDTQPDRDA